MAFRCGLLLRVFSFYDICMQDGLIQERACPPMYLKTDLHTYLLPSLPVKFDVILIEPPLEEYQRSRGVTGDMEFWDWDKIMALDISSIAAARAFVFLWCGSSDGATPECCNLCFINYHIQCLGLDMGRVCLRKWGFRRCEDICWIRTNAKNPGHSKNLEPKAVFQRTKVSN